MISNLLLVNSLFRVVTNLIVRYSIHPGFLRYTFLATRFRIWYDYDMIRIWLALQAPMKNLNSELFRVGNRHWFFFFFLRFFMFSTCFCLLYDVLLFFSALVLSLVCYLIVFTCSVIKPAVSLCIIVTSGLFLDLWVRFPGISRFWPWLWIICSQPSFYSQLLHVLLLWTLTYS